LKSSRFFTIVVLTVTMFGQQAGSGKAQLSLPKVRGVLLLNVGNASWEMQTDGKETQLRALDRGDHLIITAFLQRVKFPASADACRAKWWPMTEKSAPMKRDQLRQYEKEGIAVVDYLVAEFRGNSIRQKTMHAYLGGRDLCAEVHLSKEQFAPDDEKLFDEVLATVHLRPDELTAEDQGKGKAATQREESYMLGRVFGAVEDVGGGYTKEGLRKLSAINKDLEKRAYSTRTSWLAHHWYGKALLDSGEARAAVQMLQVAQGEASSLTGKEKEETAELLGQAQEKLSKK
jgi:hypothetical protein